MWDFTEYDYKCPYCEHEYKGAKHGGFSYKWKGKKYYSTENRCPKCGADFLYGDIKAGEDKFIKMPPKQELEYDGCWMT